MKGTVWKFGDDIDTDIILPGRYLIYTDEEKLSQHCMEGLDDKTLASNFSEEKESKKEKKEESLANKFD